MSPIRINHRQGKGKPVSLPTYSFYGHLPVVYVDGDLVIGRRVILLEPRR